MNDWTLETFWNAVEVEAGHWHVVAGGDSIAQVSSCATHDGEALAKHIVAVHNDALEARG